MLALFSVGACIGMIPYWITRAEDRKIEKAIEKATGKQVVETVNITAAELSQIRRMMKKTGVTAEVAAFAICKGLKDGYDKGRY